MPQITTGKNTYKLPIYNNIKIIYYNLHSHYKIKWFWGARPFVSNNKL